RDPSFYLPTPGAGALSNDQIRARYAPLPADYRAALDYFAQSGLTVVHAWPDGLSVTVEGSAQDVGRAFGTSLVDGTWQGHAVRMPLGVPTLPPSIERSIESVSGLSSGFTEFSLPLSNVRSSAVVPSRTSTLLWPSAAHAIYGLDGLYNYSGSPHWATGVGIALVLWGQGYAPNDIQSFFANYYPAGFPPIHYAAYPVDGALAPSQNAVNDPSNVTSEMTLDMEWAGSAAPGATLSAVYAPDGPAKNGYSPSDTSLEDALNTAVQSVGGVHVISMSFGTPDGSDPTFQAAFTNILADAQAHGITVLAASGDTGGTARVGCQGAPVPEFPAASEFVVAVGGTAPVLAVNTLGGFTGLDSEPAWNRSGGGFSTTVPAPSWQKVGSAAGPISQRGFRGIPDVAGPASDNVFFYNGQEAAGAGTSFASPMWAGIIAEMDAIRGQPLGLVTPRLYAVGAAEANRSTGIGLVDITQGSNCLGPASTGWDTATGWGSPRALLLLQDLSGTFVNVEIGVSSATVAPGQTFSSSVHVTNATSLAPINGAVVAFDLSAVNYVGPCGGAIQSATTSTAGSGDASTSLTVPGCYLGLDLVVTATVSGGSYFGSNTTTIHVNLIGVAGFLAAIQQFPYNFLAFG
ncbi:MAG: S8 family serine peptidase, partial [Thermoplasmata archaeon]|nr:S8 family serine peptidase [Thermoplasmata archaeon]